MLDLCLLPFALIQDSTSAPSASTALETTDTWVGLIQKVLTAAAILAGGIIALVKFGLLNPLRLRLEPTISGSVARREGIIYLHAQASAKNTELRTVKIVPEYTGLRVLVYREATGEWEWFATYDVFMEQIEIAANSSVGEPLWIVIPEGDSLALRLELWIARSEEEGWLAVAIVNLMSEEDNRERKQTPVEWRGPKTDLRERIRRWLASRA